MRQAARAHSVVDVSARPMRRARELLDRALISRFIYDDIFISYSRADGAAYAAALAAELSLRDLACQFDQWSARPGRDIPEEILRSIRDSGMLVVIGTAVSGRSEAVRREIEVFLPTRRLIVPIDLDGTIRQATWWPLLDGLAISAPPGKPGSDVLDRIESSITFTRRSQRLQRITSTTMVFVACLLLIAAGAALWARHSASEAASQASRAGLAEKAAKNAEATRAGIERRIGVVQKQYESAESKRREAELAFSAEQIKLTKQLDETRREQRRADQQTAAARENRREALARALGTEARIALDDVQSDLETSTLLAIEALKRGPSLEADRVLRRNLRLLEKPAFSADAQSAAMTPAGELVTGAADGRIRYLDPQTGAVKKMLPFAGKNPRFAFCPHARCALVQREGSPAVIVGLPAGAEVQELPRDRYDIVKFSPKGDLLVVDGDDGSLWLLETATGRHVASFSTPDHGSVAFAADSSLVAVAAPGGIRIFNTATGAPIDNFNGEESNWHALGFSPNAKYLAAGDDLSARVYRISDGKEVCRAPHGSYVLSLAFDRKGERLATGGLDNIARVFQADTCSETSRLQHRGRVESIRFLPDDERVLTASRDGTVRIFDASSGWEYSRLVHRGSIEQADAGPDGAHVAIRGEKGVDFFRLASAYGGLSLPAANQGVFSSDATKVAITDIDGVTVVDARTGTVDLKRDIIRPQRNMAFGGNGRYLAVDSDLGWAIFDSRGKDDVSYHGQFVAVSAESNYRASLVGDHVELFDLAGAALYTWPTRVPQGRLAFSRDGHYLIAANQSEATVFDVPARGIVHSCKYSREVDAIALANDGKVAVFNHDAPISHDHAVRVLDMQTCRPIVEVPFQSRVTAIALDRPGGLFAAGAEDGTIRVFDIPGGAEQVRTETRGAVLALGFQPDGHALVSLGGTVLSHEARPINQNLLVLRHPLTRRELLESGCAKLTHNLTEAEYRKYLIDDAVEGRACPKLP